VADVDELPQAGQVEAGGGRPARAREARGDESGGVGGAEGDDLRRVAIKTVVRRRSDGDEAAVKRR
jgi:hypothetical protein